MKQASKLERKKSWVKFFPHFFHSSSITIFAKFIQTFFHLYLVFTFNIFTFLELFWWDRAEGNLHIFCIQCTENTCANVDPTLDRCTNIASVVFFTLRQAPKNNCPHYLFGKWWNLKSTGRSLTVSWMGVALLPAHVVFHWDGMQNISKSHQPHTLITKLVFFPQVHNRKQIKQCPLCSVTDTTCLTSGDEESHIPALATVFLSPCLEM